jgi:hypothetical protein
MGRSNAAELHDRSSHVPADRHVGKTCPAKLAGGTQRPNSSI